MEKKTNTCKSCIFFKKGQMLLNYCDQTGFCINPHLSFNTSTGRLVGVVDAHNLRDRSKIIGNPSHDFETMKEQSRYHLQVEEDFGCIKHKKQ